VASPGRLHWSIRLRIMVPYLALVVALVGGTGLATGYWAAERARQQYIDRGRGIAETLRRSDFPLTEAVLRQLKGLGGAEFALLDDDGRTLASTLGDLGATTAARQDLGFRQSLRHAGVDYRLGVVERPSRRSPGEAQRLLILIPEPALRAAAWEARRGVLAFTAVGALLAAALATAIAQSLSTPLSAILREVRRIGRGELEPAPTALPTGRGDEIGELAEGVAQMARWLQKLQDERVQTERLRLVRQLSAGMAHELRNPLTAARMTLQLFIERNDDRDTEPLRIALHELGQMERQVRRFLQIARPEPPRFQPVDVRPLLDRTVAGLAATAEHRGITLGVEGAGSLPAVLSDPDQLGQILSNLLHNALDAAGPGGRVTLRAAAEPAGSVAIDVEDDGPGVPRGDLDRLFQPFFTTKPEGVGLGLALCSALAHEHRGTLDYARGAGRTRFRLTLPALSQSPNGPSVAEPAFADSVVGFGPESSDPLR
jgi:signal transduction histidine kinase